MMKLLSTAVSALLIFTSSSFSSEGFVDLFEPYFGKSFSAQCGETMEKALMAPVEMAAMKFVPDEHYGAPYLTIKGNGFSIYLKALDSESARLKEAHGGDLGGKIEKIRNSFDGKVFRQESVTRSGLIFMTKTMEFVDSIDFSDSKAWVYQGRGIFYDETGRTYARVCILRPHF